MPSSRATVAVTVAPARAAPPLRRLTLSGPLPEAAAGDVATLIGRDGDAEITVEEVALQAGTISYEILTGFTPRLARVEP